MADVKFEHIPEWMRSRVPSGEPRNRKERRAGESVARSVTRKVKRATAQLIAKHGRKP